MWKYVLKHFSYIWEIGQLVYNLKELALLDELILKFSFHAIINNNWKTALRVARGNQSKAKWR